MPSEEIWKPINGYDHYEVSDYGNIRSTDHYRNQNSRRGSGEHFYKGKILKTRERPNGYLCVHLSNGAESKWESVHRLVAEAFCEHKDGFEIVNHIDNNKQNNTANNLEWTDYNGNMQWASKQGRMKGNSNNLKRAQESRHKPVIATDRDGNEYVFNSITSAAKELNLSESARKHISQVCQNQYGYKTTGGYKWRYKNVG